MKLAISGDIGSGKSTLCKILSEELGFPIVSIGKLNREKAESLNMSISDFSNYMLSHPEIEEEFDNAQKAYENSDENVIIDSRLGFHFVPSAISIYLKVSTYDAALRIFKEKREKEKYETKADCMIAIDSRAKSERQRYWNKYRVDIQDELNYDFIISTADKTPEEIAQKIIRLVRKTQR